MKINKLLKKRKNIFLLGLFLALIIGLITFYLSKQILSSDRPLAISLVGNEPLQVMAEGSVVSQNQENLHFQSGGKVVYLFREGDQVFKGQVIAGLDSLEAQKNVTAAEANYRSAKSALELVIDNIHLFQYGNGGFANVGTGNETQTQKTQRQQAEEVVNVAYDSLQKAKKQLEETSLIAPFDGTIISEDVKEVGVTVTPAVNFVLADLNKLIFQAQVSASNITYITVGDKAQIQLNGMRDRKLTGFVSKIYPEKIKLLSGGVGYKVDIESDNLASSAKFGMSGSVIFENNLVSNGIFVPSWTVLGNHYVWVIEQNTPKLKEVKIGETFGDRVQILAGLSTKDKVITDPQLLIQKRYKII